MDGIKHIKTIHMRINTFKKYSTISISKDRTLVETPTFIQAALSLKRFIGKHSLGFAEIRLINSYEREATR